VEEEIRMTSWCKYLSINKKMPTGVNIFPGKDAALEAAHEELHVLKEITSFDVSTGVLETDYKQHLEEYHKRVSLHHCLHIFLGFIHNTASSA
jgi:hypothetical protein